MKHILLKSLLLSAGICTLQQANSQNCERKEKNDNAPHQRVTFIISHTHIPALNEYTGEKKTFIAASIGANYEYWFNNEWAVGLHNDLVMQSFHVEQNASGAVTKREYPLLTSLVGIYKPIEHWTVFAGPGAEFEKRETVAAVKTGIEYSVPLRNHFDVGFGIEYDVKIRSTNTWLIGIGISKSFF